MSAPIDTSTLRDQWIKCSKIPRNTSYQKDYDLFIGEDKTKELSLQSGVSKIRDLVVRGKIHIYKASDAKPPEAELMCRHIIVVGKEGEENGQIQIKDVKLSFRYCFQMSREQLKQGVMQSSHQIISQPNIPTIPRISFPLELNSNSFLLTAYNSPIIDPLIRLIHAAHHGDFEPIQMCIAAGIDRQPKNEKRTVLMQAAEMNDVTAVRSLLAANARLEDVDAFGNTALTIATRNNRLETTNYLLTTKADLYANNALGKSPIRYAVDTGSREMINLFVTHGANLSREQSLDPGEISAEVMHAAVNGDPCAMQRLFQEGGNLDAANHFGDSALILAADQGHTPVVEWLIQAKADTEVQGTRGTALDRALQKGHPATILALLSANSSLADLPLQKLNDLGKTASHAPLLDQIVKFFSQNQPEILQETLNLAAYLGCEYIIRSCLTNMDVWNGDYALINAAQMGHSLIVKMLLEAGADGATAFTSSVILGDIQGAKLLKQQGVMSDRSQIDDSILLAYAALTNDKQKMEELLTAQINPNATDPKRRTALMRAISVGNREIVEMLLRANVDLDVTDELGETAIGYAAVRGQDDIVQMLLQHGANPNPPSRPEPLLGYIRALHKKIKGPLAEDYSKIILLLINAKPTEPTVEPIATTNHPQKTVQWAEKLEDWAPNLRALRESQTEGEALEAIDAFLTALVYNNRGFTPADKKNLIPALDNPIIQENKDKPGFSALFQLVQ